MSDGFNWNNAPSGALFIRAYGNIAVHLNEYADIVIRQETQDDDAVIVVSRRDVQSLIRAIKEQMSGDAP